MGSTEVVWRSMIELMDSRSSQSGQRKLGVGVIRAGYAPSRGAPLPQSTPANARVLELEASLDGAEGDERALLQVELADVRASVGSIDAIIPAARLRPHLIEAVERGIAHTLEPSPQEADRG
jgi:hypothetical protein